MNDIFDFSDEFGPSKVIHVYEPSVSLKAILVVDNVARGPSIGGVRMAPNVSALECFRLARTMTFKNASAGLPHGGGKAVLYGDPKIEKPKKSQLIRALASSLRNVKEYIFTPDMGTNEECMAWVKDEIGRVVGLPEELGGIPLDEIGATGWGIYHATDVALRHLDFELDGARVVIQGFGAVGKHAARFLTKNGAILVGIADSSASIYNPDGLDLEKLVAFKESGQSFLEFSQGRVQDRDSVVDFECDIWIPAARPDVINETNVDRLKTKLIVEGANIPITLAAERKLSEKGILYIPDFIANAGGVICAATEYAGGNQTMAMNNIEDKIRRNTEQVLKSAFDRNLSLREAANELAVDRVKTAMGFRRWSLLSSTSGVI